MSVYILPDDNTSRILQPDITVSESHDNAATVTEHPVEEGVNVADHIRIETLHFSCVVYVTRTPIRERRRIRPNATDKTDETEAIGTIDTVELDIPKYEPPLEATPGSLFRLAGSAIGAALDAITGGPPPVKAQVLIFPEVVDQVKNFHDALIDLQERGQTCQVITTTQTYKDMVVTRITLPITEAGGGEFTIDFQRLKVVSSQTVKAPKPAEPRGAPAQNKGGQSTDDVSGKDAEKASVLNKLVNFITGSK